MSFLHTDNTQFDILQSFNYSIILFFDLNFQELIDIYLSVSYNSGFLSIENKFLELFL